MVEVLERKTIPLPEARRGKSILKFCDADCDSIVALTKVFNDEEVPKAVGTATPLKETSVEIYGRVISSYLKEKKIDALYGRKCDHNVCSPCERMILAIANVKKQVDGEIQITLIVIIWLTDCLIATVCFVSQQSSATVRFCLINA